MDDLANDSATTENRRKAEATQRIIEKMQRNKAVHVLTKPKYSDADYAELKKVMAEGITQERVTWGLIGLVIGLAGALFFFSASKTTPPVEFDPAL